MADVELTFLQDLPAHSEPKDADLLLVNTENDDKSLTLKKLAQYITTDMIYPVGVVMFFAKNKDPNDLFPGTTWQYIDEDRVIRLGKQDGSDLLLTGGSDTVQLTTENLPPHAHSFSGSTSSFDYGNKASDRQGLHGHNFAYNNTPTTQSLPGSGAAMHESALGKWTGERIAPSGEHVHSTYIGAHSHTVSGNTGNTGAGRAINLLNSHVKLMGWYRIN